MEKSCVVTGQKVNAFKAVFKFSSLHYHPMTVSRSVFTGNVNVLPGTSCYADHPCAASKCGQVSK